MNMVNGAVILKVGKKPSNLALSTSD